MRENIPDLGFHEAYFETEPEILKGLTREELERYHAFFVKLAPDWTHHPATLAKCRSRIDLLGKEIELRRVDDRNRERHSEVIVQGGEVLLWTKRGAKAAIIAAILAGLALIPDIPFSKLLRALSSQPAPAPTQLESPNVSASEPPKVLEPESTKPPAPAMPSATTTTQPEP
jgi:hypothetical protein